MHDLIHTDQFPHTITDQLSECERHNLQSLTSLNSQSFVNLTQRHQERICAKRTPPAQKAGGPGAKQQGAKANKKMEQHSTEYKLSREDTTAVRALSARANDLSQDRADICFGTKELCREVAVPNRHSHERLKIVCRYLVGKQRLVHKYDWGSGAADADYLEV